jgi:hypothetical protein
MLSSTSPIFFDRLALFGGRPKGRKMQKQIWLSAVIVLVVFMVGLVGRGVAQTYGRPTPLNERNRDWELKTPLAAAKAAAARTARSKYAVTVPRSKAMGTFVTFDAPGDSNGTFPTSVSGSGIIVGNYNDANSLSHGFIRAHNGTIVTVDVPGAVYGTYVYGVNNEGAVTGGYGDNVGSGFHSFVRAPNGTISSFDPPGSTFGSNGNAINPSGAVTGQYYDENFLSHGFLRTNSGAIITFDAPNATFNFGTNPTGITAGGLIQGFYSNGSVPGGYPNSTNGFLMTSSGGLTTITGPGGLGGQFDPFNSGPALSINPPGVIAGVYFQPINGNPFGGNFQVFVLSPNGNYVTFAAANYPPCCIWSAPSGINPAGTITGSFNDGFEINHGFWRTSGGTVTTFDVPGAGTGFNQGTLPMGITPGGVIAGSYRDANSITHGFLFQPM